MLNTVRKLILTAGDAWMGYEVNRTLRYLEQTEYWSRTEHLEYQNYQFRKLIQHVSEHVPFYRSHFLKYGIKPSSIKTLEDIKKLPIVDKKIITKNLGDFISNNPQKPMRWLKTSGTTGEPFRFVLSRKAQSFKIAHSIKFKKWYNVDRVDRQLVVGGIPQPQKLVKSKFLNNTLEILHSFSKNRYHIYSHILNEEGINVAINILCRKKYKSIMGYPSAIALIAKYAYENKVNIIRPSQIFTNSEILTDEDRSAIENAFGVIPRNEYAATEGAIAHECPYGSMHIALPEVIVEESDDIENEKVGELLVTFLHTYDFPFIRYRIGDIGIMSDRICKCGMEHKLLDNLIGRTNDMVEMPDGRKLNHASINMKISHWHEMKNVAQYQIVQKNLHSLMILIVGYDNVIDSHSNKLEKKFSNLFSPMDVNIRYVNEVRRDKNGKYRPIVNLVHN